MIEMMMLYVACHLSLVTLAAINFQLLFMGFQRRLNCTTVVRTEPPGSGDGSRLYEVIKWLWSFGRGMLRSKSVAEVEQIRNGYRSKSVKKSQASRKQKRESIEDR